MESLNILFISSFPPDHSAGLARDYMRALTSHGHKVDFLTRYDFPGQKDNEYNVYSERLSDKIRRFCRNHPIMQKFRFMRFLLHRDKVYPGNSGIIITNLQEGVSPVSIDDLLSKIAKPYDAVVTLFWQHMLTTVTLKAIYDKLKCPIIIWSVDMFTFTGGCFYFMECRNFLKGCGRCPALASNDPKDQTAKNFQTKKQMYASMNYAIGLNTWMQRFALPTGLFDKRRVVYTSVSVDENLFTVMSKDKCRKELGISSNKTFILLARHADSAAKGKGYDYLVKAVNSFAAKLNDKQKQKCLIVLAGKAENKNESQFSIDTLYIGPLSRQNLIKAYNASNIFLSPSIDDAGPSMVNQSIMCGTPAICFEIGTALDVIDNGISGYKVQVKDYEAFADAIYTIYNMPAEKYDKLQLSTREMALKHNSLESFARMIENTTQMLNKDEMKI